MAVEVFKEPYCRRHYARRLSLAFIARILGIIGSVVLAFVVAYSTGDFWQRTGTWQEQPRVSFTNDMLLVLQVRPRTPHIRSPLRVLALFQYHQ